MTAIEKPGLQHTDEFLTVLEKLQLPAGFTCSGGTRFSSGIPIRPETRSRLLRVGALVTT